MRRPSEDPLLILIGKERDYVFHDFVFKEIRPDKPPRPEGIVNTTQEWPYVAVWHLARLGWIVQRRANVDVWKTGELQQRSETFRVRRIDIDHC